jgi:hypothetical protein
MIMVNRSFMPRSGSSPGEIIRASGCRAGPAMVLRRCYATGTGMGKRAAIHDPESLRSKPK